jgi:hypothetical protein
MKFRFLTAGLIGIVYLFSLGCEDGKTDAVADEDQSGSEDEIVNTVVLTTLDGVSREVEADVVDGLVVAEGDMILGPAPEAEAGRDLVTAKSVGVTYTVSKWPNALVPYTISPDWSDSERSHIELAIALFNRDSSVKFIPRTVQTAYVTFEKSYKNESYVGYCEMETQPIYLNVYVINVVLHEMGHTVGLYHEHQRQDRDSYITFINPDVADSPDYQIITENTGTYDTPFDYASIMLYPFSFKGLDGKEIQMTNEYSLSALDIIGIARMYNRPSVVRYNDLRAGDFNGDGLSDLLFTWGDGTLHVALTQLVGSVYKSVYAGEWITNWGHGHGLYQLGDFSGDGKSDVMFIEPGNDTIHVAISTGADFHGEGSGMWIWDDEDHTLFGSVNAGGQYRVGNFGGDEKDDLLFIETGDNSIHVALSTGHDFYGGGGQWIGPNEFGRFYTGQYTIGNFDGDGYDDLLYSSIENRKHYVALSTGDGFAATGDGVWYDPNEDTDYFLMDPSIVSRTMAAVDIDKDGKDDLVVWTLVGKHFRGARSTGTEFESSGMLSGLNDIRVVGGEFFYGEFTGDPEGYIDVIYRIRDDASFNVVPNEYNVGFNADNEYQIIGPGGFGDVTSYSRYL